MCIHISKLKVKYLTYRYLFNIRIRFKSKFKRKNMKIDMIPIQLHPNRQDDSYLSLNNRRFAAGPNYY